MTPESHEASVPLRAMHEWSFSTSHHYAEPFTDVTVRATFVAPSGDRATVEAFHDGGSEWRVRFNPGEPGQWNWRLESTPPNPDFEREGSFDVPEGEARGFLKSTPSNAWGFAFENGDPVMIFGDTVYHLFAMAHNSEEGKEAVGRFLQRRAEQGFNLLRIRLPVSEFHQVDGYNTWQARSMWPWRGGPQNPRFDQFNLEYFQTVDWVMEQAESLGIGIEMILEGWGDEFPFNSRHIFVAEWEELWVRYILARYDAFNAVWFWQLHNEYEYYPNGDWNRSRSGVAERWAIRMAHLVRRHAPHGHVVAIHNGPEMPSFGQRFASDPTAIDTVMFQTWGTTSEQHGWLAAGIDDRIRESLHDWPGSAVLSEWGYEFNPELPPMMLGHRWCDADHTRRGAWRGVMSGVGIIHGFENSWGPFMVLDEDQEGLDHLLHLRHFFSEVVPFDVLKRVDSIATNGDDRRGHAPLVLSSEDRGLAVVYLPVGGDVTVNGDLEFATATWFDPRTGVLGEATEVSSQATFSPPEPQVGDRPDDWVLVLRAE